MDSMEYDEYRSRLRMMDDTELDLEMDDSFIQMADEDESIKYVLCVQEHRDRVRKEKDAYYMQVARDPLWN